GHGCPRPAACRCRRRAQHGEEHSPGPTTRRRLGYLGLAVFSDSSGKSLISLVVLPPSLRSPPLPPAMAKVLPSGEKESVETGTVRPGSVCFKSPVCASHRMTSPLVTLSSSLTIPPVAKSLPSGENATATTQALFPC